MVAVSIIALQFSRLSYMVLPFSTIIEVRAEQPSKAYVPIVVTLLGMVMEIREMQDWKALHPMLSTLLGIVTEVREEQLSNA